MDAKQTDKFEKDVADLLYQHEQALSIIAVLQDAEPELYTKIIERLNLV